MRASARDMPNFQKLVLEEESPQDKQDPDKIRSKINGDFADEMPNEPQTQARSLERLHESHPWMKSLSLSSNAALA